MDDQVGLQHPLRLFRARNVQNDFEAIRPPVCAEEIEGLVFFGLAANLHPVGPDLDATQRVVPAVSGKRVMRLEELRRTVQSRDCAGKRLLFERTLAFEDKRPCLDRFGRENNNPVRIRARRREWSQERDGLFQVDAKRPAEVVVLELQAVHTAGRDHAKIQARDLSHESGIHRIAHDILAGRKHELQVSTINHIDAREITAVPALLKVRQANLQRHAMEVDVLIVVAGEVPTKHAYPDSLPFLDMIRAIEEVRGRHFLAIENDGNREKASSTADRSRKMFALLLREGHGQALMPLWTDVDRDRFLAMKGIRRCRDGPGLVRAFLAGDDHRAAIGEGKEAHAGGVFRQGERLRPFAPSKRKERAGIVEARAVIGDADCRTEPRILDLVDQDLRGAGAPCVLEEFVEDIVDRGVEKAADLFDSLRGDLCVKGKAGHSEFSKMANTRLDGRALMG